MAGGEDVLLLWAEGGTRDGGAVLQAVVGREEGAGVPLLGVRCRKFEDSDCFLVDFFFNLSNSVICNFL